MHVDTPSGAVAVTVAGDLKGARLTVLTYGDVGSNHRVCVNPWVQVMQDHKPFHDMSVVNVDPPGHEDGAKPLVGPYPTMDELAAQVDAVVRALKVPVFVGLGVGAGANVLLRYAARYGAPQYRLQALMLVSGSCTAASRAEWLNMQYLMASVRMYGLTAQMCDTIAGFRLSTPGLHRCGALHRSVLSTLPASNVLGFMRSYLARGDLPADLLQPVLHGKVPVIAFAGSSPGTALPLVPVRHCISSCVGRFAGG